MCNSLANNATTIAELIVAQDPPAASTFTGGQLPTGTFFRTATMRYLGTGATPGPSGADIKETISITATGATSTIQTVITNTADSDGAVKRFSFTGSASGSTLTVSFTCPTTGDVIVYPYTYAGGMLSLLDTDGDRVLTYVLQN